MKSSYRQVLRSEAFIFTAILCLFFLGLGLYTLDWPPRAGLLPMFICGLIFVITAIEIVNLFRKAGKGPAPGEKVVGRIPWQVIAGFAAMGVVIPLGYALSLSPAVGIMGAGLSVVYGERRWWVIILIGIASFLLMHFLFGEFFGLPMRF